MREKLFENIGKTDEIKIASFVLFRTITGRVLTIAVAVCGVYELLTSTIIILLSSYTDPRFLSRG